MKKNTIIIIGGGVAGLSCLNAVLDKGMSATLLETSSIGSPKMCGEYISPLAVEQLEKWNITGLNPIRMVNFSINKDVLTVDLKNPAAALSRSRAELILAQRAKNLGAEVKEQVNIQSIKMASNHSPHQIILADGTHLYANTLVFATGKYNPLTPTLSSPVYYGIKMQLPNILIPNTLSMFIAHHFYLGIIPLDDCFSNSAWLLPYKIIDKTDSFENTINSLITSDPRLIEIFLKLDLKRVVSLKGAVGEFGLKKIPVNNNRTFWIGDALSSFPPAIGYGFAHSVCSSVMAANYIEVNDAFTYHQRCISIIKQKLTLGRCLHYLMLKPNLASTGFRLIKQNRWLIKLIINKINQPYF